MTAAPQWEDEDEDEPGDCESEGVCLGLQNDGWCEHCPFYEPDVEEWERNGYD